MVFLHSNDDIDIYRPKCNANSKLTMEFLLAIYVDYHYVCDTSLHNVHPMCPTLEIMRGWQGRNDAIMCGSNNVPSVRGGVRPLNIVNATGKGDESGAGWEEMFVPKRLYGEENLLRIIREDSPLLFSVFCKKVFDDAIDLSNIQSLTDHMVAHLKEKESARKLTREERQAKTKASMLKSYLDPSQEETEDPMAAFALFFGEEGETKPEASLLAKVEKPEVSDDDKGRMLAWLHQNNAISKIVFKDKLLVGMLEKPGLEPFQSAHKTYLDRLAVQKLKVKEMKSSATKEKRAKAKADKKAAELASKGGTAIATPQNRASVALATNAAASVAKKLMCVGGETTGGEKRTVNPDAVLPTEPAKRARSGSFTNGERKEEAKLEEGGKEEAKLEEEEDHEEEELIASDKDPLEEEEPIASDNDPLELGVPSGNNDETMDLVDDTHKDEATGILPNSISHDSENAGGSVQEDDN